MFYKVIAPLDEGAVLDIPANDGYDPTAVRETLNRLAAAGDRVVAESLSDEQRQNTYYNVAGQAARLGVAISRVFGSRRGSGVDGFGSKVPALLVYESEGSKLVGIYPHWRKEDQATVTIADHLESVAPPGRS